MKIHLRYIIAMVALTTGFSSCLKDDSQPDFTQNKAVIEIPIGSSAGNGGGNSINAAFTISETESDYSIYVNYAAPEANEKDVTVTLAVNNDALTKFNTVNEKAYTLLPANSYTIANYKITIPAGQRKVIFPLKIKTSVLDPTLTYALPLSITDGGGFTISANFGTLVSIISLKNKWDGIYTVTGTMTDVVNSSLTGQYPRTYHLITQGPHTVAIYDPGNGGFAHGILNGGSGSTYGNFSPVFTIDESTNKITSTVNYYGQPSSNGRSAKMDATGANAFSMNAGNTQPTALKVKYIMNQDGTDRTFFDETWTYKSAR